MLTSVAPAGAFQFRGSAPCFENVCPLWYNSPIQTGAAGRTFVTKPHENYDKSGLIKDEFVEIKKIGILGAGIMGGEIAYVMAQAGLGVVMKDVEQRFLDTGMDRVRQIFAFKVKRRRMSQDDMDAATGLVETTLDYDAFADVDFIIEAVPEELGLKQRVFAEIEGICRGDVIIASNTSALSITEIAAACDKQSRVAGMHFFNPVSMMKLVEVIRGKETSGETIDTVCALCEQLGKAPVVCADSAGFIVNRLLCAAMMEAVRCEREGLLQRGWIDNVLVKPAAGLPVGLFRMADQLGIDLLFKVMKILESAFGERMAVPREIAELFAAGQLGLKTGRGFYDYSAGPPRKPGGPEPDDDIKRIIVSRVLGAVVAEARRLVSEGVAGAEDVDTAMKFGALFKKPPFKYTLEVGAAEMDARLAEYALKYGGVFVRNGEDSNVTSNGL